MKSVIIFTSDLYQGGVAESTVKLASILSSDFKVIICSYDSLPVKKNIPPAVLHISLNCPLSVGFRENKRKQFFVRTLRYPFLFCAFFKFIFILLSLRPTHVYSLTYIPNILNVISASLFKHTVVLSERQDPRFDLVNVRFLPSVLRFLYRFADKIHVNSGDMVRAVKEFYDLDDKRIIRIDNYFFLSELREKAKSNLYVRDLDFTRFTFVSCGRLSRQKGIIHQIYILRELSLLMPRCQLLIIGEGELRTDLTNLIFSLGLQDTVYLLGNLDNPYPVISKANCFLSTSLWESFGNVLLEAMTLGVPVVSTSCLSGPAEILDSGTYGLDIGVFDIDGSVATRDIYSQAARSIRDFCELELSGFSKLSLKRADDYDAESVRQKILSELFCL